eukprot:TRINITY_DN103630_c0_g1_i1.p1 TRINITY_DN103630_c0_g1~~TRINITY_DN103630_c0_g1_i1.p1  ORF type:complete len:232 (+),score=30.33 TRINITY_DN103630_c0_g1_i1:99-794(+)
MSIYCPNYYKQPSLAILHRLMKQFNFAMLLSVGADGVPSISHIPFTLKVNPEDPEHKGKLVAHVAKANQHWKAFEDGNQKAMVIFQGPHAYISPMWYENPPNKVPTWDYCVVHAHGTPKTVHDKEAKKEILTELVANSEGAAHPNPDEQRWSMEFGEKSVNVQLSAIVGLEIEIDELVGKWKANQNHPIGNQKGCIAGLRATGNVGDAQFADWMEETCQQLWEKKEEGGSA